MSGGSGRDNSQSTPSGDASKPAWRARARPFESGSTPTMYLGCTRLERSSLYMRSVPMLPEPTMAAVTLLIPIQDGRNGRPPTTGRSGHRNGLFQPVARVRRWFGPVAAYCQSVQFSTMYSMLEPSYYCPLAQAAEESGFSSIGLADSI